MEGIYGKLENIRGSESDLVYLADSILKDKEIRIEERPRLYSWCGTEDFLYTCNLEFEDEMKAIGMDLDANHSEGEHNWTCWDREIQKVLKWFSDLRNE